MRRILFILFLFISAFSHAEVLDSVEYRIVYGAETRIHVDGDIKYNLIYLDVGRHVSYFYNYDFFREHDIRDSLKKVGYNNIEILSYMSKNKFPDLGVKYTVLRNYPSEGRTIYTHYIFEDYFFYEEESPKIEWELVKGDTIILNYPCRKALCEFGGKRWTVYYTLDIPLSEGPFKLCGLPGLILYASESKGDFTFSCIGIECPKDEAITVDHSKWQKTDKKKLNKMLVEYYDDRIAWAFKSYGILSSLELIRNSDPKMQKKSVVPCLIEE